ncbi:FHA domain-containing protein [Wukongibacter baidiensis]|uniref:FHA domain-containing protein n=1 Tax=Wukongibacter baidiensis TaxID=1723361 RepID=UPI003D7FC260
MSREKNKIMFLIELGLAVCFAAATIYVYKYSNIQSGMLKSSIIFILTFTALYCLVNSFSYKDKHVNQEENNNKINSIALINEEDSIVREWEVLNEISLVIGRNTKNRGVDIDLDTSIHSSLIDNEHAVLNFASNNWYIEDLYSKNGVKIQKDDNYIYKISKDKPCMLEKGDIVFIGKTKLLIR